MKAIEKIKETVMLFESLGIDAAQKEAEILLKGGLNISTVDVLRDNPELSQKQIKIIDGMLDRRLRGEPFQYIVGYEEFMGLRLAVGPGVLIPRPETEFLAEQAIKAVKRESLSTRGTSPYASHLAPMRIFDICTGCGCLALSLARQYPDLQVYATDISGTAIEYAKKNAAINMIENAIFLKGSLFQPVEKLFTVYGSPFAADLIISNPPYVNTDDIKTLQTEIKDWEPLIALDGGPDGLGFYRELIPEAGGFLKDGGIIMLELGVGQAGNVKGILKSSGYTNIETTRDYSGIERIIRAEWKR